MKIGQYGQQLIEPSIIFNKKITYSGIIFYSLSLFVLSTHSAYISITVLKYLNA